jgi:hypothetical protein
MDSTRRRTASDQNVAPSNTTRVAPSATSQLHASLGSRAPPHPRSAHATTIPRDASDHTKVRSLPCERAWSR